MFLEVKYRSNSKLIELFDEDFVDETIIIKKSKCFK